MKKLCTGVRQTFVCWASHARGQPPASVYTFKHVLIEGALYSAISEARRSNFISEVADAIEGGLAACLRRSRKWWRSISPWPAPRREPSDSV